MADDLSTQQGILEAVGARAATEQASQPESADILGAGEGVEEARAAGPPAQRGEIPPELRTQEGILDTVALHAQKEEQGAQPEPWWKFAGISAINPLAGYLSEFELGREFLQPFARIPPQIGMGAAADVAAELARLGGRDRLDGKPLEQVQAERDRIADEQADVQKRMDALTKSGTDVNFDQLMALGSQNAELERMKQENNAVLASGQVKTGPTNVLTQGADWVGQRVREGARQGEQNVQNILPTTEELDNSIPGQIASGLGTVGTLAPLALLGPEAEIPAMAMMASGQQYEDAVKKGADENTAENAALLSALASPIQSLSFLPGAGLARKLGGMTTREAITELSKAAGYGAVGSGAYQYAQNAISVLSGYDPDRHLDEGVLNQVLLGGVIGGTLGSLGVIPGYARYLRGADVEVRDKPGTPAQTGQVPPPPEAQTGAPVTPITPPSAILTPQEEAAARVQAQTGKTPEQVLTGEGTAQQALEDEIDRIGATGVIQPSSVPAATETREVAQPALAEARPTEQAVTPAAETKPETVAAPETTFPSIAHQNAFIQLVRRGMTPSEAYNRISQSKSTNYLDILRDAAGRVVTPPEFTKPEPVDRGELDDDKRARALVYDSVSDQEKQRLSEQNPEAVANYNAAVNRLVTDWNQQSNEIAAIRGGVRPDPIEDAYNRVRSQQLGSAVYISDLAKELGMPVPELQQHLAARQQLGMAMLEPGNWPIANEEQRAAAIPGTNAVGMTEPKLTVRFPQREAIRGDIPVEQTRPELQARPSQAEVKQTTNDAATRMGLDQVVHYVPNVDALPNRVKKQLTDGQRSTTAQTVWDHSMHELWVIGDRFDSHADLQRALIEETQGRVWRDIADVSFKHDPNDTRLGYYDIPRDKAVLNTDALMRTDDPFGNARKAAAEEIVVHKGISRLYGTREALAYKNAMDSLQRNFDQGKMNDPLAQDKGFKNLDDMAKAYGYEDYKTNPQHQHALTEELAGAYAQRFGSRQELEADAPRWYQSALQTLLDGVRRRFGLAVSPLEMQHLLADSMSALRVAKYDQPGRLMPELVAQAKGDMIEHQLASLRGGEEGGGGTEERPDLLRHMEQQADFFKQLGTQAPPPRAEPELRTVPGQPTPLEQAALRTVERPMPSARIGDEFVQQRMREVLAPATSDQGVRAQALKLAMQQERDFAERLAYAEPGSLLYDKRTREWATQKAEELFNGAYGRDVHTAMQEIMAEKNPSKVVSALREVVGREINQQIDQLRGQGLTEPAKALQLERDRFNQKMQERVTGVAQELEDQKRFTDGSQEVGKLRAQFSRQQGGYLGKLAPVKAAATAIKQISRDAAEILANRMALRMGMAERRLAEKALSDPTTLADRYIRAVADALDANFGKAGFSDADRPLLQQLFNTFQGRIQEQIREGAPVPESPEKAARVTPTESIRNILSNIEMFGRTWDEVVDTLKTENPNAVFFANLERGMAEPFGERGVRAVIGESNKLSDLILKHYSTQDRVGLDLARSLTNNLGLDPDQALRLQQRFDGFYRDILQTEKQAALQRALDGLSTKKGATPTKGEVDRLVDMLALGGFDKDEYHNIVAPRFKMGGWTPEILNGIKQAGDMLQQMRDEGQTSPVVRDRWEAQIQDMISKSQAPGEIWKKRLESTYMASLLTGFVSHTGYFLQNLIQKFMTMYTYGSNPRYFDPQAFAKMHLDATAGFKRWWDTDLPYIMRTGLTPTRGLHGGAGTEFPFRTAFESTPFEGRLAYLNQYKYVGRALLALEQFSVRGTEYAMQRLVATRLADEFGYHGADAERFADQAIYGTEDKIRAAERQAIEEQERWGFDDLTRKVRQNEILDQLRSTSDNPDTTIADRETEALQQMQDQSTRLGLHAALREDVPGAAGIVSRQLVQIRNKYPLASFIFPFNKLPMNQANEWAAWTPLGVWRGRDMLKGGTEGIQKYYGTIPGWIQKVESGQISEREMRDMAYEQFMKGAVGTAAMGVMGVSLAMNKDNPDPWFWVTGEGPSSAGGKDMAKAEGFYPYTIKLGDTRWSYEHTPFKAMFGTIGAAADWMRYVANTDDAGGYFGAAVTAALSGMGAVTIDTSPLQGLATVLSTIGPGSMSERTKHVENQAAQWASAIGLMPIGGTFLRQGYRLFDPRQYEAKDLGSIFIRNLPGVNSAFLQPRLNVFGEPVTNPPLAKLPFVPISETGATPVEGEFYQPPDPVWQYIENSGLHIQLPGYAKKIDGQAISPAELHIYHEARGKELKSQLAGAIEDPGFTSLPIDQQNKTVRTEFDRAADQAGVEAVIRHREANPSP